MQAAPSNIRVVVRLPYNRPDEPPPDPPRVDWTQEKEQMLWEVIAKSRAVEGAKTDWKGLAAHFHVPLPYLLYRAQRRYEEDLRGLQGIQGTLSPDTISPLQIPLNTVSAANAKSPSTPNGDYFTKFPTTPEKPNLLRREPLRPTANGSSSHVYRPLGVRARLNSLGSTQARSRKLSAASTRPTKKLSSSSILTLQGPRISHESHLPPFSPTHSPPASSSNDASSEESDDYSKEEEEMRRAEEQELLDRKLKDLHRMMTKDALGLVASPPRPSAASYDKGKGKETDRGRMRPLSASSTSSNFRPRLEMSRRHSLSQTPSHHSLSSMDSPQGSIPSIPSSPPPEARTQSPMARHFTPTKSTSPPAVSPRSVWGQTISRQQAITRPRVGGQVSERGSEMGSEASSFSDLSDASLSPSALESALMSNMKGAGSRVSSFARSHLSSRHSGIR